VKIKSIHEYTTKCCAVNQKKRSSGNALINSDENNLIWKFIQNSFNTKNKNKKKKILKNLNQRMTNFHSKSISSDSDDYDVIIQIKENQNIKEFRAHSNALTGRSLYFKGLILDKKIKNENNVIVINNITPTVFEMVLK